MRFDNSFRAALLAASAFCAPFLTVVPAQAGFLAGDILVSSSTYQDTGAVTGLSVGTQIPTISTTALAVSGGAGVNGDPLGVFFNSSPDGNFGVTSTLTLTQYTPGGTANYVLNLPAASAINANNGIVTSFPSKSEGALSVSADGTNVSIMGYSAPVGAVDVSNSQTPGALEPGNTDTATPTYRSIATINADGQIVYTQTNSFSGNNGRAAVLLPDNKTLILVGNAGNGNGLKVSKAMRRNLEHSEHRRVRHNERQLIAQELEIESGEQVRAFAEDQGVA